ncbi:MAG: hypothetical protein ACHQD9_05155 [Chitinophagales bacterium]
MKNIITFFFLISSPLILFAQQKNNSHQDQLRKEMETLRAEMDQKIQTLQDSLAKLQEQLAEEQHNSKFKHFEFKYNSPDTGDYYFHMDTSQWDHAFNFDFHFPKSWNLEIPAVPEVPPVPESPGEQQYEYHYQIPDEQFYKAMPYEYYFSIPKTPDVPEEPFYHEKKHKHDDFWRMMPFYDWFKS